MKKILELIADEMKAAFVGCGYEEAYAKVVLSNRPDLCEYQCNGAMAAAKAYKKKPIDIASDVVAKLKEQCGARAAAGETPVFALLPFQKKKAAIVTTGSEVYHGRIQDKFTPVVRQKLEEYGVEVLGNTICNDEPDMVTEAVNDWIKKGAQMVVCTGGMSVDPDDKTPLAIRNASDEVITYGAPVLPGAMFMLAYKGEIPIMGLPGCVMYARRTIFDLVLPRLVAGERLQDQDFYRLGEGGLCLSCEVCTFPNCGFGKG